MKIYPTIQEAVAELKAKTGHGHVRYFVDGRQVNAATYCNCDGEATIYRSGLEIHATKNSTER